ncbi:MAG: ligase-associated DNA damage response endonuclease PdeM, partial [Phyllobacteriaceae bacterium]|nr:ligase-associated DNA damage response endonuclease PdeM [Phyllobacteriaceae bacterium]
SGAAYAACHDTLLIADLHFGKGHALAARGVFLPPYDTADTIARLADVIARYAPSRIVCLGDSFHNDNSAALLPPALRLRLEGLMDICHWVWLSGNHDPHSGAGLGGEQVDQMPLGSVTLRHEPRFEDGAPEIAGHLHPCARIVQRGRSLRRRCFAASAQHLVLPAFGALTGSLNVRDVAFGGFVSSPASRAFMLGRDAVHAIAAHRLLPD